MSVRDRIQILALSAALGLPAVTATAGDCSRAGCKPAASAATAHTPLKLSKFRRRPVTIGKPARVAKTPKGQDQRVRLVHRARHKLAPQPEPPQFMPVVVSPEAAAALAMQASVAQAARQVRVVSADEFNELDRTAGEVAAQQPLAAVRVATTREPPAPAATAAPAERIAMAFAPLGDTAAVAAAAMPVIHQAKPAAAAPQVAAKPDDTGRRDWLSQARAWFGDKAAALGAAVHRLFE